MSILKKIILKCLACVLLGGICFSSNCNINKARAIPKDSMIVFVSPYSPDYKTVSYTNPQDRDRVYLIEKYYKDVLILRKTFNYGNPTKEEYEYIRSFTIEDLTPAQRARLGI